MLVSFARHDEGEFITAVTREASTMRCRMIQVADDRAAYDESYDRGGAAQAV